MRESVERGVGFLWLTSPKVRYIMVILGLRGDRLRVWLVVDEVSTRLDEIILPLFLLARFCPMGGIERVKGRSLILKFEQGFPYFGPWLL